MRADVKKIVETEVELMGGEIPYHDYTFILHLRIEYRGWTGTFELHCARLSALWLWT